MCNTPEWFIEHLKEFVKSCGSQKVAAENLEISPAYLWDILHRRREPGPKVLGAFGLVKVIKYYPRDEGKDER